MARRPPALRRCGTQPRGRREAGGRSWGARGARGAGAGRQRQRHWRPRSGSLGLGTAGVSAAPPAGGQPRPGEETEQEEREEPRGRRKWGRGGVLDWGALDRTSVRAVAARPGSGSSVPRPRTLGVSVSGRSQTGRGLGPSTKGNDGGGEQGGNRWSQRASVHPSAKGPQSRQGLPCDLCFKMRKGFIRFSCFCYLKPSRLSETKLPSLAVISLPTPSHTQTMALIVNFQNASTASLKASCVKAELQSWIGKAIGSHRFKLNHTTQTSFVVC